MTDKKKLAQLRGEVVRLESHIQSLYNNKVFDIAIKGKIKEAYNSAGDVIWQQETT